MLLTSLRYLVLAPAFVGLLLAAPSALRAEPLPLPLEPQPAAGDLKPGLAVLYYLNLFRHVDELIDWQDYKDGKKGPVLSQLNYRVGTGPVLSSGYSDGVGAHITGLIHLDRPGTYAFSVQSNDGVRLEISGVQVLEDPDVHADRFSEIAQLTVEAPGWYPLSIHYFERKNTSTLELYWQRPGDQPGTMPLVPREAFAHIAEQ